MDPNVWGPSLWKFLHIVSLNYPKSPNQIDKTNYYNFYNNLKTMLPCNTCQMHFTQYLQNNPPKLNSQMDLITWTIDLHNDVNKRNNKKIYSYDEALTLIKKNMEDEKNKKPPQKSNLIFIIIFIVLIVIIIGLILYILKNIKTKKVIRY